MTSIRLGTLSWNWCVWTPGRDHLKLALLDRLRWDVATLQEVSADSAAALQEHFPDATVICGLDLVGDSTASGQEVRSYGCSIVVRRGWAIEDAGLVPVTTQGSWGDDSVPLAASLLHATVVLPAGHRVTVVAAHAPHAAAGGGDRRRRVERKVRTYLDLEEWLRTRQDPVIIGIDGNAWIDGGVNDLWGRPWSDPNDPQHSVNAFFHDGPQRHGCRDVYRAWLDANPERLDEIRRRRPAGPLAVTFVRGAQRKVADRFDAVLASTEVDVVAVEHDYGDSVAAGSDHSYVLAELDLQPPNPATWLDSSV